MIQQEVNYIRIETQPDQNLYSNVAAQNQLQNFYLWRREDLINPFSVTQLNEQIHFEKELSMDKIKDKKVFIVLIEKQSFIQVINNSNIASYEFSRILQTYHKIGFNIQLTYNGQVIEYNNNKTINEIWPNEQFIELIAIYKNIQLEQEFQQQETNKLIPLIIQDRYKIILNESFKIKDKIISDYLKNRLNKKFFLYYENTVINENDTFESVFPNKECCKLYIVYPEQIQSVDGSINLSLLKFGEIIKTVSINSKQQIYPILRNYVEEEFVAYKQGKVITQTAKFQIAFKGQKDVCIIIQPKLQYLQQCLKVYENIVDSIKGQIEKLKNKNLSFQNYQVNEKNSYYYYFQHNSLFKHQILQDFENGIEQYFQSNTLQFKETVKSTHRYPFLYDITGEQLDKLAQNYSRQQKGFAQTLTFENTQSLNEICEECKKTVQKTKIVQLNCQNRYHIDCLYKKFVRELNEQFKNQNIKQEIRMSCSQNCIERHNLRDFQDYFDQKQQHYIQNLFVKYFAQYPAIKKNKAIQICDRCDFAYFKDLTQTEYPVCQCKE